MITLTFNGAALTTSATSLPDLLLEQGIDPARNGMAIARNGAIVPRPIWPATPLHDGDTLDVVHAIAGG